jgi:hypothetical protein
MPQTDSSQSFNSIQVLCQTVKDDLHAPGITPSQFAGCKSDTILCLSLIERRSELPLLFLH